MKKKDIIQLVKETVKENTFYGNREQPSQLSTGTKVSVPTDEYPFSAKPKRTATGMMEGQDALSSDMLNYADQYHMELVDTMKGVSTHPDKRTGGFKIVFPHYNGPDYTGAMFGRDVSDKIEKSKAAAKAAALKTVSKFQDQIEDYEITDKSRGGVHGSIHLFIMPKTMDEAPMFRTDVKQDMAPKEMAGRIKSVFNKVNGAKDPVKTPEWHKNRFKNKYGISFPETLKGINKDQALAMNKYANDMKITEADTKTYAGVDAATSMKKDPRYGTLSGDAKIDLEKKLKDGGAVELEENEDDSYYIDQIKRDLEELDDKEANEYLEDLSKAILKLKRLEEDSNFVDHEGRHAKMQLQKAAEYSIKLAKMMDDMTQLPSWVQSKITKASDYMSAVYHYLDYEMTSSQDNLMENVDKYKKRVVLMESAMKKFFEMFDKGKTDEEIVQDYAQKGTTVPEPFVTKARRQYEGMKKLKLELEMSEKEFRNSSEKMVNNAEEGMEYEGEEKTLASGLTNEEPNEGNAFGLAIQKAKAAGEDSFEVDGEEKELKK